MPRQRRYLPVLALVVTSGLLLIAIANFIIDPYGLFTLIQRPGLNAVKPYPERSLPDIKMANALQRNATALILGNSRAEIGFDPAHPIWALQSLDAYNLAIPGTGIQTSYKQLQQVEGKLHPKVIVLGVEFLDFLIDPAAPERASADPSDFGRWRQLKLEAAGLLSIQSVIDSLRTVRMQHNPYAEMLSSRGFNPLREYELVAENEGYYAMFRQRAVENARRYARLPKGLFKAGTQSSLDWQALQAIIDLAAKEGVTLKLVIYPYHAQLMALFSEQGLRPAFEAWKQHLTTLVAASPSAAHRQLELWDFSGFASYQCEPVPKPGDRRSKVQWYWEAGHFKAELGNLMLSRMFAEQIAPTSSQDTPWGVRLDPAGLAGNQARLVQEQASCAKHHPELFAEMAALAHPGS